jgi:hypothetical protein
MCRKGIADDALLSMNRIRPGGGRAVDRHRPNEQVRPLHLRPSAESVSRLDQTRDPIPRNCRITTQRIVCSRIGYACGKIHVA